MNETILLQRPDVGGDGDYVNHFDSSELLPTIIRRQGYHLLSITFNRDPYVLYNRFGQAIHQWDCGYEPSWQDVYEACQKLQLVQGRSDPKRGF